MAWKIGRVCITGFFTMFGILCVLCLPTLFVYEKELSFQPFLYVYQIEDTITALFQVKDMTFTAIDSGKPYPFFPYMLERYGYSLSLVGISFLLAVFFACIIGYFYVGSSSFLQKCFKQILLAVESLPDVMVMVIIQVSLIGLYQKTQWMPFTILAYRDERPYILPIICLCILPMIQLFRFLIVYMEEEETKPYVEVLKGKGLGKSYITVVHLFRNVIIHLFYHSKGIFLFMISNLFILEYIFNIDGLMKFLLDYGTINLAIGVMIIWLIFLPFFLLFQIASSFINTIFREEAIR